MAAEKFLSTQTSILIAGAMIATGLVYGLRGREAPPAAEPPPSAPATGLPVGSPERPADAPTTAPPAAPAAAPVPSGGPDLTVAMAAVAEELERHRATTVETCVRPALARKPDPPRVKLTFNMTFGPDGKQVTRGVSEDRETAREGVSM